MTDYAALAQKLKPYLVGMQGGGSSVAGGTTAHPLSGPLHTGVLAQAQAPWAATVAALTAHAGNPDAHHVRLHSYDSTSDHSGTLSWAKVNKAGASLADLPTRVYSDLQGSGSTYELVGWTATNTIGRRTPLWDVSGGNSEILRSNAGLLKLKNLLVAGLLQTDSDNLALGVNVTPDGAAALDVRAGAASDHTVRIRQIASQTGRLWRVESTSGQELIVLDSAGNLQSGNPGFVSGLTGWRIEPVGNAEFNNGRFRGELHATVMVFDEVSVHNGTQLIMPAGGALELSATLSTTGAPALRNVRTTAFGDQDYLDYRTDSGTGSGTGITARTIENILSIANPDTGHYQVFRAGEVLRMKVWTGSAVTDTWMRVNSALDMGTYYAYFVQVVSGSLPVTYTPGAAVAGYGKPGEGGVRISADDPYGPLIDIFTCGAAPWAGDIYPHVRLGRLDGVGVPGVSGIVQYGMVAGENLADANKPYFVASNLGVRQFKIASEWHDGSNTTGRIQPDGRVRFGTNVDSPANTFMDVNPGTGVATFRGAIEVLGGAFSGANLDQVADGSSYARVNSTLVSGGNIRVGSGVKDSTLDGWQIDGTEIVGQVDGVDQVTMGTNGVLTFGTGQGKLDKDGIAVDDLGVSGGWEHWATGGSKNGYLARRYGTNLVTGGVYFLSGGFNVGTSEDPYWEGRTIARLESTLTYGPFTGMGGNIYAEPVVEVLARGNSSYPGHARFGVLAAAESSIAIDGDSNDISFMTSGAVRMVLATGGISAPSLMSVRSTASFTF